MVLERVKKFKMFLQGRKEQNIYIVSHGNFIKALLNQTIMHMNCQVSYKSLNSIL